MPWISRRNMSLGEFSAHRGSLVPDKVIATIPVLRFNSLVRVGHLAEVESSQLGENCQVCGEGPFVRMARHMTAKHDDSATAVTEEPSTEDNLVMNVENTAVSVEVGGEEE